MVHIATDYNNIGKFLNRILGMEVQQQNALFQYFSDTLAAVIQEAKKNGRYDMGILGKIVIILPFYCSTIFSDKKSQSCTRRSNNPVTPLKVGFY